MRKIFKNEGAIQRKVFNFRDNNRSILKHTLWQILKDRGLKFAECPEYVDQVTIDLAGNKSAYLVQGYDHELEDGFHILTMESDVIWPFYFLPTIDQMKQFTNFYVCYLDVVTDLFWIFNLADFHINHIHNYGTTGMAARAVYAKDRRTDKWKLLITA